MSRDYGRTIRGILYFDSIEMGKTMNELVSIIVPVYNAEKFILQTIACVEAQTYSEWELLLVADSCSDNTVQVISDHIAGSGDERIRLIVQEENTGAARARNRGLAESKGRFVAYLDADDLWVPEKLEKTMQFLLARSAAFVFTGYEFADENGVGTGKVVQVPETLCYKQALKNTTIFTSTVMFDTEKISKDKLNMPIIKSEDTALWWRVLREENCLAYGLNENLVRYRRSTKTLSSNKVEAVRRIWNLYRRAEGMGVLNSLWHCCFWAVRAVKRRV